MNLFRKDKDETKKEVSPVDTKASETLTDDDLDQVAGGGLIKPSNTREMLIR